ncbi:glycosyltransferase family 2 protein [Flavobacterium branchiicola]|uniref:Glycosyltransferase family 2 protein n=1 Tax=Flavobacterium branchiicola TaxID=1114875 RepID=A0ABV9PFD4_9FLAO|nr:glycosyltransferase family 2 protein [Flavobacterium branchiicola]MBS7255456.1 glycosyltransferase family 2 protein [Flavobacterium branchiicola]
MGENSLSGKIAIISILYKSDELLEDFFQSLSLQKNANFTLFLLDNDANDTTKEIVYSLSDKYNLSNSVQYIECKDNSGFARGNNIVLQEVLKNDFEYILLANNDVFFTQANLLSSLKDKCAISKVVTPQILYYGTNEIWFSGGYINKYKGLNIHENEFKPISEVKQDERFVEFAPACFLMVHKNIFEKIGLFDEKFFVYWEDVDFCVRINNSGFKILLDPSLNIEHKVSVSTGGRASLFSTYYFLRNRLYFIRKHFKGIEFLSSLFYTYLTSFAKILLYDMPRKKVIIKAVKDSKLM